MNITSPLPRFVGRESEPEDMEQFQCIFAKNEGAVTAPAAGLHFSRELMKLMEIKGIDAVDALPDTKVFQAGTKREGSRTLSSGGRVLCVTALGKGLAEAQKRAYEAVAKIDMEKSQHRSDIGAKGLRRL